MSLFRNRQFFVTLIAVISILIYVPYFFEVPQVFTDIENWIIETIVIINEIVNLIKYEIHIGKVIDINGRKI